MRRLSDKVFPSASLSPRNSPPVMRYSATSSTFGALARYETWSGPGLTDSLICPGFCGLGMLESGGDLLLLVLVLVFAGCEHVQGAVTSLGVVPDLDVVMDRGGELDACLPSSAVE